MVLRRILIRAVSILAGLILALTALAAGVWLYNHPSLASVQRVTCHWLGAKLRHVSTWLLTSLIIEVRS